MAEQNKDNLADALAAFAAGHHEEPAPHDPQNSQDTAPAAPQGRATSPAQSSPSAPPPPAAPRRSGAPVPRISRPAARVEEEPMSLVRPRPTAPAPPRPTRVDAPPPQQATAASSTLDPAPVQDEWAAAPVDDDMMLAPAPDASVLGRLKSPPKPSPTLAAGLGFKQTLIPILLTSGVLLIIFGSIKFLAAADSPYRLIPSWIVATVLGMAIVMLALAWVTMLQVKFQLAQLSGQPPRKRKR